MVHRPTLLNKIRELGFGYKKRQRRTDLWRKKGATNRITLPLTEELDDSYVRSVLRQNGQSEEEINRFLAAHSH